MGEGRTPLNGATWTIKPLLQSLAETWRRNRAIQRNHPTPVARTWADEHTERRKLFIGNTIHVNNANMAEAPILPQPWAEGGLALYRGTSSTASARGPL